MKKSLATLFQDSRGDLAEAALTFPILMVLTLGLLNVGLVAFAALNASNAAHYGARVGSVSQAADPGYAGALAALAKLEAVPVGTYDLAAWGGDAPGDLLALQVSYRVPNWMYGFAQFFGLRAATDFSGSTTVYFRKEGW
jgi:hypothetical protein